MKPFERFQRFLIIILIAVGFFYGGYYMGKRGFVFEVRKNPPQVQIINQYPGDKKVDFALFWQVWDMVGANYLERPVDAQKMLYGAISGMVAALGDPYTSFLPPAVNKSVGDSLNGKYEGIGAELGLKDGQLIVVAPLDGSPAKEAGIKAGDKILKIDDTLTSGISITDAVAKIRGTAGTTVKLTMQTGDQQPKDLTLTRNIITVASVTWSDKGNGIAYIRISRFGGETNTEWDKAAAEVNVQMTQLDAVVVDVRGNPGGYLDSAKHIAEEFFIGKPVLFEELATGEQIPVLANRAGVFQKVPKVVVLIDQGSASASEILAAALKDTVNATLVGMKSFGKGTIQDAKDFSDGSGLHITIAKWLTPKKEWVHKIGITPDVVVELNDKNTANGADPQLNKALELAKQF